MLRYLIKSEVGGIEIRLLESDFAYVVIYGMEKRAFNKDEKKAAFKNYKECVNHAIDSNMGN